jgi:5-methylcytosine-specific restriction endonuclease McrA
MKKRRKKVCKECGNKFDGSQSTKRCSKCKDVLLKERAKKLFKVEKHCILCNGILEGKLIKYCCKCNTLLQQEKLKVKKVYKPKDKNLKQNKEPKKIQNIQNLENSKNIRFYNTGIYDEGVCAYCKKDKPTTFHHILPRGFGGPSVLENCIPLCLKCHNEVEILTYDLIDRKPNFTIDDLRGFIMQHNFPNEDYLIEENSSFKLTHPVQEP